MDAPHYTGSRMELMRLLDSADEQLMDDLLGWQFAAVARVLAEAGAVHRDVHTPTRVGQWLERHGWKRQSSNDLVVTWRRREEDGGGGWVYQPVNPATVDYAQRLLEVVSKAAPAAADGQTSDH